MWFEMEGVVYKYPFQKLAKMEPCKSSKQSALSFDASLAFAHVRQAETNADGRDVATWPNVGWDGATEFRSQPFSFWKFNENFNHLVSLRPRNVGIVVELASQTPTGHDHFQRHITLNSSLPFDPQLQSNYARAAKLSQLYSDFVADLLYEARL